MKLRYRIVGGIAGLLVLAMAGLALLLGHTTPCPDARTGSAAGATTMKAIVYECYGDTDVLELATIDKPVPKADEVLVRIEAAAVNPLDWHYMRGSPYFMRLGSGLGAPSVTRLGVDFAGVVEAVGAEVSRFQPGDEVFGGRTGAFAEYVTVREGAAIAKKPANVSFAEAAAVPIAGVTALQALRDKGGVERGDTVLINGASGGVGTFAVQIAKALGAEVTGVCSTRNVELVTNLGADHVVDYKQSDYTSSERRYSVIVDNVGNHSVPANRKVLTDEGVLVIIGGPKGDWFTPLLRPMQAALLSPFVDQQLSLMIAKLDQGDLEYLGSLMENGSIRPVIDQEFGLNEVADAIRYSESGRARGKIIIRVN